MEKSQLIKELKEGFEKYVEEKIQFALKYDAEIQEIREDLQKMLTFQISQLENVENRFKRGIGWYSEWQVENQKNQVEIIVKKLNEYCIPTKLFTGVAEGKNYSYLSTGEYVLLERKDGYLHYKVIEQVKETNNFKIDNKKVKSFIVDTLHNRFIRIEE